MTPEEAARFARDEEEVFRRRSNAWYRVGAGPVPTYSVIVKATGQVIEVDDRTFDEKLHTRL